MDGESMSPVLDSIVADISERGELDLTGYPPETLIVAVRETFHEFGRIRQELDGVYTTLGLLLGEIDDRLTPSVDEGTSGS